MLIIPPTGRHRRSRAQKPEPTPAPPTPVSILSITATGGAETIVAFSGPVAVDDAVGPDTALQIEGGNNVQAVAQLDANRVTVDFTGDVTAGQEWQLSGQPNWLLTSVDPVDEGGFVQA